MAVTVSITADTAEYPTSVPNNSATGIGQIAQDQDLNGSDDGDSKYLKGMRFYMVACLNGIMLFLVQTEISIVTTSLVSISSSLGRFDISNWVMSSYLLGYVCIVVIAAKLSDIFGRKFAFVTGITVFTIFSGGCAAAQTMVQLIILRAFQGLGGGCCYTLSTIMIIELVPPHRYGSLMAYTGIAIVLAMVLGPILGGAISAHTTWRWIFLFNVPVGALGLVLAVLGIPNGFPHHYEKSKSAIPTESQKAKGTQKAESLKRVDFLGCVLVLLATVSLTAAFQEAGSRFSWHSAYFITLVVVSLVLWTTLFLWERHLTLGDSLREPILPWRFMVSPAMIGILLSIILLGGPLTVTTLQIPQRFELVHNLSSLSAGVRLVPFGAAVPVGTIASAKIASALKVPFIYILFIGAALQVIGFALLGVTKTAAATIYGYEVIAGLGCGISFQTLFLAIPFTVEKRDQAVGLGTATQCRALGSALMVAVATAVFNEHVSHPLRRLGVQDLATYSYEESSRDIAMSTENRHKFQTILLEGYSRQMFVLCGCGAMQVLVLLLLWRKKQIRST